MHRGRVQGVLARALEPFDTRPRFKARRALQGRCLGTSDGEKAFAFDYGHDAFEHHHDDGHYDSGLHERHALRKRTTKKIRLRRVRTALVGSRDGAGRIGHSRFLGLAKVARLVRLVKHLKGLRDLLETLVASLPAFWNVGALVALLFFIYAYVGVILFAPPRTNTKRRPLARRARNFESFPRRRRRCSALRPTTSGWG